MKVGIDARLYFESGVGRYIKNTLYELDKYCFSSDTKDKYYVFLSSKGFDQIEFKSGALEKVRANIPWHTLREQLFFKGLLDTFDLDVMHFTYFSVPIFYKKKFVVTIHDLIINQVDTGKATTLPKPLYFLKRLAYHKVVRNAVTNSKFIISPSGSTKVSLLNFYNLDKEKVVVIPEGIDPVFLKKGKKPEIEIPSEFILYVGNAYPHKNLVRLIEAYNRVENKMKQHLILVGRKDYFYKRLSGIIKDNKKIHVYNSIDDRELSYLYSKASFLVMPSLAEGFGLTPLEAMASDCLPVVSSIDAFYEVCKNAALYFNPEDIQDIASVLFRAANMSSEELSSYREFFKKRVSIFSWEKSLKSTLEVYERCNSI